MSEVQENSSSQQNAEVLESCGIKEILSMLPHRYPFLLIDKVEDIVKGQSGKGIKNVTINEPFFQGHFPENPVMPGVLLIEALAQTSAIVVLSGFKGEDDFSKYGVFFMTVNNVKFRKPVLPGDTLELFVDKENCVRNVWKFKGEIKVKGALVAQAEFSAMIYKRG
jgi:3-hydroxyacyl-[acyl-carrier-protein] dehydratase